CTACACLPSFTNINNAAIVTGAPPAVTGISGNYFLDPETGREVMMNSASFLRCETILTAAARTGRRVAMVTAKDKLRDLLCKDLGGLSLSAECGIVSNLGDFSPPKGSFMPVADIYSAEASLFVLRAGVHLLESDAVDFCYLTTTDFIQHRYPPEAEEALEFYSAMDCEIGKLMRSGAMMGITADHGMNAKTDSEGKPIILFLEELLRPKLGSSARVICPITDPYTVHHASLGSAVMVYLEDKVEMASVAEYICSLRGIEAVLEREDAARELELPSDRIGDLIVFAERDFVIGKDRDYHDLTALKGPLRSHGGRAEQMVPFIVSRPLRGRYADVTEGELRNHDIFDACCNGLSAQGFTA
ncbi:MAG: phosphonoacetate hydrolase, partial [Deltaproteobacteria bacterium]|nr:phosphonoacetate hydrolase [Deltaproteobacteria bacterium]